MHTVLFATETWSRFIRAFIWRPPLMQSIASVANSNEKSKKKKKQKKCEKLNKCAFELLLLLLLFAPSNMLKMQQIDKKQTYFCASANASAFTLSHTNKSSSSDQQFEQRLIIIIRPMVVVVVVVAIAASFLSVV